MRVLIVEDEPLIARRVERMCREVLGARLDSVRVASTFDGAGVELQERPIDLLLLDLNLNGEDGMELLKVSVAGAFHTVIVSANTDQALRAFEFGVADFVPKPFSVERLRQALSRITSEGCGSTHSFPRARLLAVRKHGRIEIVPVEAVIYVQGAGNYSELVLRDGRRELHDKSLERLATVLPDDFTRIHRSHLARLSEIVAVRALEGSHYEAELRDGRVLPVGRTRYKELRERLG